MHHRSARPFLPGTILGMALAVSLAGVAGSVPGDRPAPVPEHHLTLEVVDETGAPLDARVEALDPLTDTAFFPVDRGIPVYDAYTGHRYFYALGATPILVHEGPVALRVSSGFTRRAEVETLWVNRDLVHRVRLPRVFDAQAEGWYGGDTHVHLAHGGVGDRYLLDDAHLARVARAEDLNFTGALTNGPYFNAGVNPHGDPRHLVHFAMEYRSAIYGHMALLGLDSLLTPGCCLPGNPSYPLNRDVGAAAHAQGATVVFAHPMTMPQDDFLSTPLDWPYSGFARELPLTAMLGAVDAMDVFSYSNYQNSAFGERANERLWFDLLNLGLRLPLSVGTDTSVNRWFDPPAGGYRVYARVDGPLTLDSWLEALRAGRTFGTNGPMPWLFTLNDAAPGDSVFFAPGEKHKVTVRLELYAREPVATFELILNGAVALSVPLDPGPRHDLTLNVTLPRVEGWAVARITGAVGNPSTVGNFQEALTSPIYLVDASTPALPLAASVNRFQGWLDDLETAVIARNHWDSPVQEAEVLAAIDCGRTVLAGDTCGGVALVPRSGLEGGAVGRTAAGEASTLALHRRMSERGAVFDARGPGEGLLEVFDVTGRLVYRSVPEPLPAVFRWWEDGPVGAAARGVYFARIRTATAVSPAVRVTLLR